MKSKQQKRLEAQERQAKRDSRSALKQLHELDRRLGRMKGSKKERNRLMAEYYNDPATIASFAEAERRQR